VGTTVTRRHDLQLYKKLVEIDVRKFNLGNRVCDEWNRLPEWVVNGKSVNKFKGNLDYYRISGKIEDLAKFC